MNGDDTVLGAAQRDLSAAHVGGAPGVLVSGLAWLAASSAWSRFGVEPAFAVLFVGGMLIVPVSGAITRFVFRAPTATHGKALDGLGLESAVVLFGGLLIAYALLRAAPELAFPATAITIGTRYFAFRTLYGEPAYWGLGAVLAGIGAVSLLRLVPLPGNVALIVGGSEIAFAALLFARWRRQAATRSSAG